MFTFNFLNIINLKHYLLGSFWLPIVFLTTLIEENFGAPRFEKFKSTLEFSQDQNCVLDFSVTGYKITALALSQPIRDSTS